MGVLQRFRKNDEPDDGPGRGTGAVAEGERGDREDRDGRDDRREGVDTRDRLEAGRLRQRDEFGGVNFGSAFFGWLVAIGIAVLLTAILSAAGTAIGLTSGSSGSDASKSAGTIGIVGGALLVLVLVIAYYAGGYVAGRMSRFDGARQGFATWVIGLIITLIVAAAGAIAGSQYNVFSSLKLPRIPVKGEALTTGGAITLAAIFLGTLLAAILGGKVGERYHRKVDRAGRV